MIKRIRDHENFLTLMLVLSLMVMIFCFSAQPAAESDEASGFFVSLILRILYPDYGSIDQIKQTQLEQVISLVVRKTAHVTEYALLGFALLLHLKANGKQKRIHLPQRYAFIIGSLYAVLDEVHQVFVPGRSGEVKDVLLDSLGVLIGNLMLLWLEHIVKKKKKIQENRL